MVLITSCSSDDSPTDAPSQNLLPQKIVQTIIENGYLGNRTYTFTYDGNKLKDITFPNDSKAVYTYTGDLITKVESYHFDELESTDYYTYEAGKLVSKINTSAFKPLQLKTTFVYNVNGTVSANLSQIQNGQETKLDTNTLYTFENGNLVSSDYVNLERDKITTVFDDKKSPFTNVAGVQVLVELNNDLDFYSANNVVKNTKVHYNSSGVVTKSATVTNTNKYNSYNFLTEVLSGDAKNSLKLEITY